MANITTVHQITTIHQKQLKIVSYVQRLLLQLIHLKFVLKKLPWLFTNGELHAFKCIAKQYTRTEKQYIIADSFYCKLFAIAF